MKSYRKERWFHAKKRRELLCSTDQVEAAVQESGLRDKRALIKIIGE